MTGTWAPTKSCSAARGPEPSHSARSDPGSESRTGSVARPDGEHQASAGGRRGRTGRRTASRSPSSHSFISSCLRRVWTRRWRNRSSTTPASAAQDLPPAQRSSNPALEAIVAQSIRKRLRFAPDSVSGDPRIRSACVILRRTAGRRQNRNAGENRDSRMSRRRRLSARIISVDPYRVGSHEKLRSLAKIMGLGFTAASTHPSNSWKRSTSSAAKTSC